MVDILLHDKPRRWVGTKARANCYLGELTELPGGKHARHGKQGRPRGMYLYSIKIVHDPLDVGGFAPGTEFSILEKDYMLQCGGFTIGTALIVDGTLHYVHGSGNNGQQCFKKFKAT